MMMVVMMIVVELIPRLVGRKSTKRTLMMSKKETELPVMVMEKRTVE